MRLTTHTIRQYCEALLQIYVNDEFIEYVCIINFSDILFNQTILINKGGEKFRAPNVMYIKRPRSKEGSNFQYLN